MTWELESRRWENAKQQFWSKLTLEQQATVGKIDPFVLTEMIKATGHVDQRYVEVMLSGFPVTGVVDASGTGEPLPGGRRTHRRPAHGVVPDLADLRANCVKINNKTIRRAPSRLP